LHEKQKTKKRHKNISREHFSITNFDPKLRAKRDTGSKKFIKLLKEKIRIFMCEQDYANKKLVITKFSFFLQTLNSNFRLNANRAYAAIIVFTL